ncbi:trans-sulfuration enzyme family protein [Kordiimonas aquimaris]|uniref:trans-sulfuration enzyme family protein n=1 Tax=Kordiimonas aquimaris TaxID=707591 RepID=UPI0021D3A836|nr:aminotransferase class I/II-fold pyridoxal phosphate-dependent enzyme [Kordiimonas aquimaris]
MTKKTLKPATIAARAAGAIDQTSGGVVPSIQLSTTYARNSEYALINPDNAYGRDDRDNIRLAETILAKLENAKESLLFPSGMAATAAVFRTIPNKSCVVVQTNIYWGTLKWIQAFCARREIELHELDTPDNSQLKNACENYKPALVLIETPSNPWLKTTDIVFASKCAKSVGALLLVDGTAATPILTKALDLGADIVMQSATKAINGHSDVLAGVLSTNAVDTLVWEEIKTDRHDAGAVLSAFDAWLLVRGMRTLPLRMERMCSNAQKVAEYLEKHPHISRVLYPGLPSHEGYKLASSQMTGGYGCLMSFLVNGSPDDALKVAGNLHLFHRATSLGGVESLVEHRHTIEPHTGIPENLLRISVGIEDASDLISDLNQALNSVFE